MVPVELDLTNFLSYGTKAPTLHFDQFHVACLSGRNGQGKSALLDAITWALWGEARKSSGNRKPDDDLIRIGTRHMQVDFAFDVGGERYRVTRMYQRSATGKTTKSNLEFHLYEPERGDYRPLTAASQRETQELIDHTLGLDYDTFINSAFLLQGRSDEFTKKRPSERKEILTRILDLSRYKALARMASDRRRTAKEQQQAAAHDVERLQTALEEVPAWRRARKALKVEAEDVREALAATRAEEQTLTEQLADLEAKAREAETVRKALADLDRRIAEHQGDAKKLGERIDKAERLVARSDRIQRDYDRYQKLQAERDALDTKRDVVRSLEKQLEQQRGALRDRKNDLEKRIQRLELEAKGYAQEVRQIEAQLNRRPALRQALRQAQAARKKVEEMQGTRERMETLRAEKGELEKELASQAEGLKSRHQALTDQFEQRTAALPDEEALQQEEARLKAQQEALREARQAHQECVEAGQSVREAIGEEEARLALRRKELAEHEERLARVRSAAEDTCPTCGTELTAEHRTQVEASLRTKVGEARAAVEALEASVAERAERRAELLAMYHTTQARIGELEGVVNAHAAFKGQVQRREAEVEALGALREEAQALRRKIDEKAYGQAERERWRVCNEELKGIDFDQEAYERVRDRAAQAEQYEGQLRELEELDGRREQLQQRAASTEEELQKLRRQLDDGSAFAEITAQVVRLEKRLAEVGFDGERFEVVRAGLRDLAEAGTRMQELVHAQQNRSSWEEQRQRTQTRLASAREQKAEAQATQGRLAEALEGRDALKERRQAVAGRRKEQEDELAELQQRQGQLNAKLERAREERARLDERKQEHGEARRRRNLYKHLRTAFGKHGIPSLIIEQTLPEIEERANALLGRLTDGKMHVRLETLKDKKTGGTKETLDIIITDEQGVPRPYETFSGGEAFRVNFALRIALAQLLAERNGVRIRTLVIDEGFGTQDQQGIQSLVEAIQVIQSDFDKIVVITHLEELKQVFPVRIEVEKDPVTGSSFEVMGV